MVGVKQYVASTSTSSSMLIVEAKTKSVIILSAYLKYKHRVTYLSSTHNIPLSMQEVGK